MTKMRDVTLVIAYYDNPNMLAVQYQNLRRMTPTVRSHIRFILVDDGSPNHPAHPDTCGVPLEIYRIDVDVRWNQDAARNCGVSHVKTPWVLMTDMDHLVPETTWIHVLVDEIDPSYAYQFRRVSAPDMQPYKRHPNTWLLTKDKFDRVGGYDERLAGLYGTDKDFQNRLAGRTLTMECPIIRYGREVIEDASTTSLERKRKGDKTKINELIKKRGDAKPLRGQFPYHQSYP